MKKSIMKVVLSTALITSVGFGSELVLSGEKVEFSKKLSLNKIHSTSVEQDDIAVLISLKDSLTKAQEDNLYIKGAKAVEYAGIKSYYVVASPSSIEDIISSDFIDGVAMLEANFKINKDLKDVAINDEVKVTLMFLKDVSHDEFSNLLVKNGIEYKDLILNPTLATAQMTITGMDIEKVASFAVVKQIRKTHKIGLVKPFSAKISTADMDTVKQTRADVVWRNNTGLDGLNIPVGVVDEGRVLKTHREFTLGKATRVKDKVIDGSSSLHSTHVAGIIGARGVDTKARGMAESAQIYNFSYNDYYFADAISVLSSKFDILVSNHSYGFTEKVDLGVYNSDASSEDKLVYNNPYLNIFIAAGNDRVDDDYPDTGIIKGAGNAKNVFTIGALDYNSNACAYYSSTGPTKDFRIKPDLSVRGSSVYSTSNSGSYAYMTGTSMATPGALGLATLVMQEYKNLTDCGNGVGCDMRHDLLKAVLINTAVDKGVEGPDVYTGYGMIDVQKAVEVVKTISENKKSLKLDKVGKGAVKEYSFHKSDAGSFAVTLSWVDPAGNSASSGKQLVNDMDIYLVRLSDNKKFYPYSLNKSDVTQKALHDRKNDVDNTEKIEVKNLQEGDYKLVVDASHISTSKQEFALASSEAVFDTFASSISLKQKLDVNNFAKVMLDAIY